MALSAPLLTQLRVLQISTEATAKGTITTPATDIWVQDLIANPVDPFVERQGSGSTLGHSVGVLEGTKAGACSFKTELRTTGASGMNAGLAILLQSCGIEKTLEVYTPTSDYATQKTASFAISTAGVKKIMLGCMGTFTLSPENGRLMLSFTFSGAWSTVSDLAVPTPEYSTVKPLNWGHASNVFSLDGESIKMTNWTFDIGNTLTPRMTNGAITNYMITKRDPTMTMDVEADLVAGYAFNAKWLAYNEGIISLAITDGTDTATLLGNKFQYREIPEGDRDGIATHDLVGQFNREADAGDDEFSLTIT